MDYYWCYKEAGVLLVEPLRSSLDPPDEFWTRRLVAYRRVDWLLLRR